MNEILPVDRRLEQLERLERLEPVGLIAALNRWNDLNCLNLQPCRIGSNPLFVMAPAASGEARNRITM